MNIHKTAIVSDSAILGKNVEIGPHAMIEDGVVLGDNCKLFARAHICAKTVLGANCKVHMNAVIGNTPQDLGFDESIDSNVVIGENTVMREGMTIHRATKEGHSTRVGANCFLMAYSHIAHDCIIGDNVIMANGALVAGHARIGDRVFLSGNSAVHQFCHIGRMAMVGGVSRVNSSVPPFMIMELDSLIRRVNVVGLKRAGFTPEQIDNVKRAYRVLYRQGLLFTEAYAELEKIGTPEALELVEFCRNVVRPVCRHA